MVLMPFVRAVVVGAHRLLDRGVPELLLHLPDVGTVFEEPGGERVAEAVRVGQASFRCFEQRPPDRLVESPVTGDFPGGSGTRGAAARPSSA